MAERGAGGTDVRKGLVLRQEAEARLDVGG